MVSGPDADIEVGGIGLDLIGELVADRVAIVAVLVIVRNRTTKRQLPRPPVDRVRQIGAAYRTGRKSLTGLYLPLPNNDQA